MYTSQKGEIVIINGHILGEKVLIKSMEGSLFYFRHIVYASKLSKNY